jgi:hypothetical protein
LSPTQRLAKVGRFETGSLLNTICESDLAVDKAETLRKRLLDPKQEYGRLFTFLKHKEVQPTNNQAEQSLRNMVIFRKICLGDPV